MKVIAIVLAFLGAVCFLGAYYADQYNMWKTVKPLCLVGLVLVAAGLWCWQR